jgi:hypothetical protein
MNFRHFKFIPIALLALGLVGCASTGGAPEKTISARIKPGMTMAQVVQTAGNPQNRHSGLIGPADETWIYSDGAMNLIPIYGLVRGARTNSVQIMFKNGRVVQIGESSTGMW